MQQNEQGDWMIDITTGWPSYVQLNVFGNDNFYYGDSNNDGVVERLPPNSVAPNYLNMSAPPYPALAWTLVVNDATGQWSLLPIGHSGVGATMFFLLLFIPLLTAVLAVVIFRWQFYGIRHNKWGAKPTLPTNRSTIYLPIIFGKSSTSLNSPSTPGTGLPQAEHLSLTPVATPTVSTPNPIEKIFGSSTKTVGETIGWPEDQEKRRKVLIATLEYEIIDWKIKVK